PAGSAWCGGGGGGRGVGRYAARQHPEEDGDRSPHGGALVGGQDGGLSGPAIRAVALEQVDAVARRARIPVVGMGGIATGRDAADFLAAGASCVAVGTESFRDPAAGRRIAAQLATAFRKERELSTAGARESTGSHQRPAK